MVCVITADVGMHAAPGTGPRRMKDIGVARVVTIDADLYCLLVLEYILHPISPFNGSCSCACPVQFHSLGSRLSADCCASAQP